jgi:hypothetical protein
LLAAIKDLAHHDGKSFFHTEAAKYLNRFALAASA